MLKFTQAHKDAMLAATDLSPARYGYFPAGQDKPEC